MAIREPLVLNPAGYQEVIQTGDTLTFNTDVRFGAGGKVGFFGRNPQSISNYTNLSVGDSIKAMVTSLDDLGLFDVTLNSGYDDSINKLNALLIGGFPPGGLLSGDATGSPIQVTTTYDPNSLQAAIYTPAGVQFKQSIYIGTVQPTTPSVGTQWVDTSNSVSNPGIKLWNGTSWLSLSNNTLPTDLGTQIDPGDLYVGNPRDLASGIIETTPASNVGRLPLGNANEQLTIDPTGTYPQWRQWFYYSTTPPTTPEEGATWLDINSNQFGIYDKVNNLWYRSYFNNANLNSIAEETFSEGDLIVRTATDLQRLPKGDAGKVLKSNASTIEWDYTIAQQTFAPPSPNVGDLWFNSATGDLSIAIDIGGGNTNWQVIGFNTARLKKNNTTTPVPGMAVAFVPGGFVPTNTNQVTGKRLTGIALYPDPNNNDFWYVSVGSRTRLTAAEWDVVTIEPSVLGLTPGAAYYLTNTDGMITKLTPSTNPGGGSIDAYVGVALSETTLLLQPNTDVEQFSHSLHFDQAQFDGDVADAANPLHIYQVDGGTF